MTDARQLFGVRGSGLRDEDIRSLGFRMVWGS